MDDLRNEEINIDLETIEDSEYEGFLSDNNLRDFLLLIRKYKPATKEENLKLFHLVKEGNENARELMINKNLRLVIRIALRNKRVLRSYDKLDIIQDGIIGLITAIDKFDETRGAFSTCAEKWIKQAIGRGIDNNDKLVRRPPDFINNKYQYMKLLESFEREGKVLPNDDAICEILGISKERLKLIKEDYKLNYQSLDEPLKDEDGSPVGDFVGSDEEGYKSVLDKMVEDELVTYLKLYFTPFEYYILYHRVLSSEKRTLRDIAAEFGVTFEYIRQKETKIFTRVRTFYDSDRNIKSFSSHDLRDKLGKEALRREPREPVDIIKYLFLRDCCSEVERTILKEVYCSERANHIRYLSSFLKMSVEDVTHLIQETLDNAEKRIAKNREIFECFKEYFISIYGAKSLNVDLEMDVSGLMKSPKITYLFWKDKSYQEFLEILDASGKTVPENLKRKIEDFFNVRGKIEHRPFRLEIKMNKIVLGLYESDSVPNDELFKFFLTNGDKFSDVHRDALLLKFGRISYADIRRKYPDFNYHNLSYAYDKLLALYFGFRSYRNYNFNREKYLEIRNKCLLKLDERAIQVLDNFYGYRTGKNLTQQELADSLGMTLEEVKPLLRTSKRQAGNIYMDLSNTLKINFSIYRRYLSENPIYFDDTAMMVVKGILFEDKTYEELASQLGKTTIQVSNYLTDALWKIDSYRFGFQSVFPYPVEIILEILERSAFTSEEKEKLKDYFVSKDSFAKQKTENRGHKFYDNVKKLYKLCLKYMTDLNSISSEEVKQILEGPHYKNVLTYMERLVLSLLYGARNDLNPSGIKLSKREIVEEYNIDKNRYYSFKSSGEGKLIAFKLGYMKNNLDLVDVRELDDILRDRRLPLSENDRYVLSRTYGLNGMEATPIDKLASENGVLKRSAERRIIRALILIRRYQNGEIEGKTVYEEDVEPYLKYFAKSDQEVLKMYYKDGLIVKEIGKKLGMTFGQISNLFYKLKVYLYDLQKDEKGFDFDYFWSIIDSEDIPIYGCKDLAVELFDLYFEKRIGMTDILLVYHPELTSESMIKRIITTLMIAVSKRKMGIKKIRDFSYEEIREYYLANHERMSISQKRLYYNYFDKMTPTFISSNSPVSIPIAYDLSRSNPDFIDIHRMNREDVLKFLGHYKDYFTESELKNFARIFKINFREMMAGSDKKQVLEFLSTITDLNFDIKKDNSMSLKPISI